MQARAFLTPTFAGRRGYLAIWLGKVSMLSLW